MSVFGWVADVLHARTQRIAAEHADLDDRLDHSYERLLTGLQETKLHLADVRAQQDSLARQAARVDAEAAAAEQEAQEAVRAGRDDLARAALVHAQDARQKRAAIGAAMAVLTPQLESLAGYERKLAARVDQFSADRTAAQAGAEAGSAREQAIKSLAGIGAAPDGALRLAQDRADAARFKADALEGLMQQGVLGGAGEVELSALTAGEAIEAELRRLKARA